MPAIKSSAKKACTIKEKQGNTRPGQCRIIAGKWRGRKISFNDADGLRPTTDRIRETVFNWLQTYLPDSHCLDCFAGSGALGFEAFSRGANKVVFIEQNKTTVDKLKENARILDVRILDTGAIDIILADTLHWLKQKQLENEKMGAAQTDKVSKFDLVFLDPPFHYNVLEEVCMLLDRSGCLTDDALIYVEQAAEKDTTDKNIVLPDNWVCLKQKRAGQVEYRLFERQSSSEL